MEDAIIINVYAGDHPHSIHQVDETCPDMVERAGYITLNKRIEAMDAAGERLLELRAEQFDLAANASDEGIEPSLASELGVDPSDLYQAEMAAKTRLTVAQREYDALLKQASKIEPEKVKEVDDDGSAEVRT